MENGQCFELSSLMEIGVGGGGEEGVGKGLQGFPAYCWPKVDWFKVEACQV